MRKLVWMMLAALHFSISAFAQTPPVVRIPPPPADSIMPGEHLVQPWNLEIYARSDNNDALHFRIVTGGGVLNWIPSTPATSLPATPDVFLWWCPEYNSYCRFIGWQNDLGECVSWLPSYVVYHRLEWHRYENTYDRWWVSARRFHRIVK